VLGEGLKNVRGGCACLGFYKTQEIPGNRKHSEQDFAWILIPDDGGDVRGPPVLGARECGEDC